MKEENYVPVKYEYVSFKGLSCGGCDRLEDALLMPEKSNLI